MSFNFAVQKIAEVLPWRIAKTIKNIFPPACGYYSVISTDPIIIIIQEDFYDNPSPWIPFFAALEHEKVHFFCIVRGPIESDKASYWKYLEPVLVDHRRRYPLHQFIFLANNAEQLRIYDDLRLPALLGNHNIFVNHESFLVAATGTKKHDAIYNAVMLPSKRHYLASAIAKLAIITYMTGENPEYFSETTKLLNHATWHNFESRERKPDFYRRLPISEIPHRLNEARVGLCLSEAEGAMFASMEYLLCGLPIVSTPSLGGRDIFFEQDYVKIVEPDVAAVSKGVDELISRAISPDEIRKITIQKVEVQRTSLADAVARIFAEDGRHIDRQEAYARVFSRDNYRLRDLYRVSKATIKERGNDKVGQMLDLRQL